MTVASLNGIAVKLVFSFIHLNLVRLTKYMFILYAAQNRNTPESAFSFQNMKALYPYG